MGDYHRSITARQTFERVDTEIGVLYGNGRSADILEKALFGLKRNTLRQKSQTLDIATEDRGEVIPQWETTDVSLSYASDTPIKTAYKNQRRN